MIQEAIGKAVQGKDLTGSEMRGAMEAILRGEATPAQIGALLVALRMKGETVEEIVAAARVMREHATRIQPRDSRVVDTCGTGGDGAQTFNISTAAALVAAGAGVTVAKHGNRSVSSRCGSADVLEALGVPLDLEPAEVERCLNTVGIAFLFAPRFHPAMKHAAAPRRELGIRTLFNLLGPLSNPAGASAQVLGVFDKHWVEPIACVLADLGVRRGFVVHGSDGLDEITLSGPTDVAELLEGRVSLAVIRPEAYGLTPCRPEELRGGTVEENARIFREILEGKLHGAKRDVVVLNAAAAIVAGEKAADLGEGIARARQAIDSGAALGKVEALREFSKQ
ncbi:MAG: anthranilate phosphoribosyltransferase [Nitrospirae bacterium]|nr:anthranilate phosphoribosyltransferase [Nitrospirota bacterium]